MVLTEAQAVAVFKSLRIPYSADAIKVCTSSSIGPDLIEKWFKAAYYVAAKDRRTVVSAQDLTKVLAEMY